MSDKKKPKTAADVTREFAAQGKCEILNDRDGQMVVRVPISALKRRKPSSDQ